MNLRIKDMNTNRIKKLAGILDEGQVTEAKLGDTVAGIAAELNQAAGFDNEVFQVGSTSGMGTGPSGFGGRDTGNLIRWTTYGAKNRAEEMGVDISEVEKEAKAAVKQWLQSNTKPVKFRDIDTRDTKTFYIKGPLAIQHTGYYLRVNTKRMLQNKNRFRAVEEGLETGSQINEGPYDDRVKATADLVNSENPDGVLVPERAKVIVAAATKIKATEMRGSEQAKRDFIKDVAKLINTKRKTSSAVIRRQDDEKKLQQLAYIIEEAIGNAFPDGDPFDAIMPAAKRIGLDAWDIDLMDWVDRATKKYITGSNMGYHDYLASVWDEFNDQTDREGNPWR